MSTTGMILAGGRSSRMGTDKALLDIHGTTVIEKTAAVLESTVERIIIIANEQERYEFLGKEMFADVYPGFGPLAGIHAGLLASTSEWSVVVACDMPFVNTQVIHALLALTKMRQQPAIQAIVPVIDGCIHPLLALYHRSVLPAIEQCLLARHLRITEFLDTLHVWYADEKQMPGVHENERRQSFFNMNAPEDYQQAVDLIVDDQSGKRE